MGKCLYNSLGGALRKAMDEGRVRYIGSVCSKHPVIGGERYTKNSRCISCGLESVRKNLQRTETKERLKLYRKTPERRAWRAKYRNRPDVKAKELAYKRSDAARASTTKYNKKPERIAYGAAFRRLPEQVAKRALRKRMVEQHISKHATPSWANKFFMGEMYDLAKRRTKITGIRWEVDHIIPLVHDCVCGLHVHTNMRVIPAAQNRLKSNRLIPALIG